MGNAECGVLTQIDRIKSMNLNGGMTAR
jgi:hypothetical protein